MVGTGPDVREDVDEHVDQRLEEPPMYKVLLHNDDYSTMEFVVEVLMFIFDKSHDDAMRVMMHVHRRGMGVCGVYTHEVAETKVDQVHRTARERGFPLKCSMEKE